MALALGSDGCCSGTPLEKCFADSMCMDKESRKHKLGSLQPASSLLQVVQDSLQGGLPEDAHVRPLGDCVFLRVTLPTPPQNLIKISGAAFLREHAN
ncbi:unnamed protein product [Pleuronectes platessa]|uniref:Uncharacterized protein n=1 Tax=Pleuronectes platessa TaxID=8262 RepID=A0A9N7Y9Q0_PLEPL|nr:unnamed protein product [Pleuronectes platessa]